MKFSDLVSLYGRLPQAGALLKSLSDPKVHRLSLDGLMGSSVPLLFSSLASRFNSTVLFILDDAD
jgi:transcription-repair coupling factor (superfamily II helicase)